MERILASKKNEVSIARVYVKSRTKNLSEGRYGFAIDVECFDVFLTDSIKSEIEKLCAFVLNYVPEINVYRHIKDRCEILEFYASQFLPGSYKVSIVTPFEQYIEDTDNYNSIVTMISKSLIERLTYLFSAFSLDSY